MNFSQPFFTFQHHFKSFIGENLPSSIYSKWHMLSYYLTKSSLIYAVHMQKMYTLVSNFPLQFIAVKSCFTCNNIMVIMKNLLVFIPYFQAFTLLPLLIYSCGYLNKTSSHATRASFCALSVIQPTCFNGGNIFYEKQQTILTACDINKEDGWHKNIFMTILLYEIFLAFSCSKETFWRLK